VDVWAKEVVVGMAEVEEGGRRLASIRMSRIRDYVFEAPVLDCDDVFNSDLVAKE
jgi:hypothetical protein